MQHLLTISLFVIVFVISIAFSAMNTTAVTIHYYLGVLSLPLAVVVILSIVFGIVVGALVIWITNLPLRQQNCQLAKKLAISQQEVNSLRILPAVADH